MATAKRVLMKAKAVGTVVDAQSNIIHVDPDNKNEKGRYTDPIVDEVAAKKLEDAGFAERVKGTDEEIAKMIVLREAGFGVDAENEAKRVEENAGADEEIGTQTAALSTRDSVNFPPDQGVRDGVDGSADQNDDDAPPATTGRGGKVKTVGTAG
jgi:hypothetical protein